MLVAGKSKKKIVTWLQSLTSEMLELSPFLFLLSFYFVFSTPLMNRGTSFTAEEVDGITRVSNLESVCYWGFRRCCFKLLSSRGRSKKCLQNQAHAVIVHVCAHAHVRGSAFRKLAHTDKQRMEKRRQVKTEISPIEKSRHKKLGVSTDGAVICPGGTDRRDKDLAVSEAALLSML